MFNRLWKLSEVELLNLVRLIECSLVVLSIILEVLVGWLGDPFYVQMLGRTFLLMCCGNLYLTHRIHLHLENRVIIADKYDEVHDLMVQLKVENLNQTTSILLDTYSHEGMKLKTEDLKTFRLPWGYRFSSPKMLRDAAFWTLIAATLAQFFLEICGEAITVQPTGWIYLLLCLQQYGTTVSTYSVLIFHILIVYSESFILKRTLYYRKLDKLDIHDGMNAQAKRVCLGLREEMEQEMEQEAVDFNEYMQQVRKSIGWWDGPNIF